MKIISESAAGGVRERRFGLEAGGETVPGLHWLPDGTEPAATVLIGHGGSASKEQAAELAGRLVRECGYAAIALDAPGHGDRITPEQRAERAARVAEHQQQVRGRGLAPRLFRSLMDAAPQAAAEWRALLDELGSDGRPFGYYGVSMGTINGMRLLAGEPRISAAVLGLGGLLEEEQRLQATAITIPLLFLCQWDDQLMERSEALALWDALGSADKTMHVNPGPHGGIPEHERDATLAFLRRHLGG